MILEAAVLYVRKGQAQQFEEAFAEAQRILSSMDGYIAHELQRCVEVADKYLLLARWRAIEDYEEGFRRSAGYQQWKELLHHFYEPFPVVEHFERVESTHGQ